MLATQTAQSLEDRLAGDGEALVSPFGAATLEAAPARDAAVAESYAGPAFASPFGEAMVTADEAGFEAMAMETVLSELRDESFDEAVQALVDEVAARHLGSTASWSSESEAPQLAVSEAEAWIGQVAGTADRLLERLEERFAEATFETFDEATFESEGLRLIGEAGPLSLATEEFIRRLVKKAKGLVKGAVNLAKRGIQAIGKFLPIGKLFGALRKLVQPLLKRVLNMAIGRLPEVVQPIARTLAAKLFGSSESEAPQTGETSVAEVTEAFDSRLAESVTSSSEAGVQQIVAEAEAEAGAPASEAVGELDAARARLAGQLESATPGVSPVAEVEQFIPIVMAAMPVIRLGIKIIGRGKVVGFLADKLAGLIKGHIGAQAARQIARPIVDVGLRLLSLEAEAPRESSTLGSEALVATLEDTLRTLGELPAEAFADPLRLEAEVHEAFAEAVARHVPRSMLSPNLPTVETAQDHGVWIFMPRVTRPCYRYKKFTRVFQRPIDRPTARSVRFPSGDTLERRLLDAGARVWPVQAEVHLYETLPGTQLGHLAAFETEQGLAEAGVAASEFEELTPEVASMLVGEPGLGRNRRPGSRRAQRLFRVAVPGARVRRARRFVVRLDASGTAPALRLHLRLSERESHEMAGALGKKALAQVVAQLRTILGPAFKAALATRLGRHLAEKAGVPVPPERPGALADALVNGAMTVVSARLPQSESTLAQAARDPARGVTLTFAFAFADKPGLLSGTPAEPALTIRPGWQRD